MTINELYNIWYGGNRNNTLRLVSIEDQRQYRQLKEGIQYDNK